MMMAIFIALRLNNNMKVLFCILIGVSSLSICQVTGLDGWDIYIDPGHSQTANMGVNGYSEAEEVLRVGLHLQDILLSNTDIDTAYICRTNDQQDISLYQRTTHANNLGASWYHSIHSNAGASDHNNTLLLWGELYNGNPDPPVGGEEMSEYMIDLLTQGMRIPTIGSWGDCSFYTWSDYCASSGGPYLYVNRNTTMPSELSEEGHHTNPPQNQLTMNEEYKRMLAYTFYWSILEYHEIERPFVGICSGVVTNVESGLPINGAMIEIDGETYTTDTYESLFYQYSTDAEELRNGFYYFEGLEDTTYTVIISAEGYYSDTSQVEMVGDFIMFHDVGLLSDAPPSITHSVPEEGENAFPAWDDILITFNRPMNPMSVLEALTLEPSANCLYYWHQNQTILSIHTDTLSYIQSYTLTIQDFAIDVYGHQLDGNHDGIPGGEYTLSFTTGAPDMTAPIIDDIYPPNVAQNIELHPIVSLTFDEAVGPDSVITDLFYLERFFDHSIVPGITEHYSVNEHSIFNFFPYQKLEVDEIYVTRLLAGLSDEFNNQMTTTNSFSFRTDTTDLEIINIDSFESNVLTNWWDPQTSGSTTGIVADHTSMSINTEIVNHLVGSSKSMQVDYAWNLNSSSWLIRVYLSGGAPRNVQFTDDYSLQLYVFGDGSGTKIRFCVDDNLPSTAASYHEVSPWYIVDWYGWRLISWDMTNDGTGSWLGDGNLNGTLRIDSIQLTRTENSSQSGTLYFDDLRIADNVPLTVEETSNIPHKVKLYPGFPNPFNSTVRINYEIEKYSPVTLEIFDIYGRIVKTIVSQKQDKGNYSVTWHGKNEYGSYVSSGTYLYRLTVGTNIMNKKITLIK